MANEFLNYFSLFLLFFIAITLFYGIIAIHDIPYKIAEKRNHPHQDAIEAAGWVSLFMLHVLWPFLWIWAMTYREERGWGFSSQKKTPNAEQTPSPAEASAPAEPPVQPSETPPDITALQARMAELETQLNALQSSHDTPNRTPQGGQA